MVIDYFTKQIKVASFKVFNSKKVAQFIQIKLIFLYGVQQEINFNNGSHFHDETTKLLQEYNVKHHESSQ